jgi:hypothetical protein
MSRSNIPVKTSEGVQEIKARALGLAPRIRTALLLVDGVKSAAELERLMAAAGVTPGALQLLIDKGLIRFQEEPQIPLQAAEHAESDAPGDFSGEDWDVLDDIDAESSQTENVVVPTASQQQVRSGQKQAELKDVVKAASTQPIVTKESEPIIPILIPEPRKPAAKSAVVDPPIAESELFPEFVVASPQAERVIEEDLGPALEVATLIELESILGDVTKAEMDTILGVATQLELTPTQTLALAPKTAVQAPAAPGRMPPLVQAEYDFKMSAAAVQKPVIPAAILRMNLTVARAHLANVLDLYLEIDGYALKQNVMGCESREELEQLFRLVEGALMRKLDRPAVQRIMGVAQALLER